MNHKNKRIIHCILVTTSNYPITWSHGVMVSTLDFESSDPSSNLGGTSNIFIASLVVVLDKKYEKSKNMKNKIHKLNAF